MLTVTVCLSDLSDNDLLKLQASVAAEVSRRNVPRTVSAANPVEAKPLNRSPEHMAAMRAKRAANQAAKGNPQEADATTAAKVERASKRVLDAQLKRLEQEPKAASFRVRKPTGELCSKRFSTAAECQAWVASWCKPARLSSYSVVSGA